MNANVTAAAAMPNASVIHPGEIAPEMWELVALGALSAVAILLYLFGGFGVLNAAVPVLHGTILALGIWRLMVRASGAIWTPLFAYRVSALLVFGIGAFISVIADAFTRDYELALYAYTDAEAAKVNLIWLISTFLVIAGATVYASIAPPERLTRVTRSEGTLSLGVAFFALGFGLLCLYEIPTTFGLINILVPGVAVLMLQAMGSVGVFLISLWALEQGPRGIALITLLFTLHVLLGLLILNKTTILFPQMLISLAFLMKRVTAVRLGAVFVAGLLTFVVLQPLVGYGRTQFAQEQLDQTLGGRLSYVPAWFRGEDVELNSSDEQINPLLRLSYLNAATFVVTQYDTNQPSETIRLAFVALIPRVLWPDKPILTAVNEELFYELTGHEGSNLSTTVPVDTYWNFGWPGLALMFALGVAVMAASMRCYALVAERRWLMLPFVLICWRTANSVDGQFVNAIFAPAIMALVIYFGLKIGSSLFLRREAGSTHRGAQTIV